MAIRFREGRKAPWQTYWNNPFTGKRESANFLTELEAKKYDSLIKHRLRYERESFEQEAEVEQEVPLTLEQAFFAYTKQKNTRRTTFNSQLSSMKRVAQFFGDKPITEITKADIQEAMRKSMIHNNIKKVTVRNHFGVMRTIMYWAADQGLCEKIDFPHLPQSDGEHHIPPTPSEIAAIIEHANPNIQRICILGSQFGLRVGPSELFRLTWQDVDLNRRVLRVHSAAKNKQCPWREIPIRESLMPIFEQWKEEDKNLSPDCPLVHYLGKPVSKMQKSWQIALERAGIKRRIRLYDLRHAFATEAIAGGADIGTVASLMGHANPNMILKHYQFVTDRQKKRVVEALPEPQYVPKSMCHFSDSGQKSNDYMNL